VPVAHRILIAPPCARQCYSFQRVDNDSRLTNLAANDCPYEAKRSIQAVISSTRALIQRDPEQEIQGIALAVADAAIEAVKAAKPDDPIVQSTASIYSADQIGAAILYVRLISCSLQSNLMQH
jgi:hypothetical protein